MELSAGAACGLNEKEAVYSHFRVQCDSILRIVQHYRKPEELTLEEKEELKYLEMLINQLDQIPEYFVPYDYYSIVVTNWDVLGDHRATFRLLGDLVALGEAWKETPEYREKARKITTCITLQ